MNRSKSLGISSAAFAGVPCLEFDMDYILDSLLISSYLLLPSTFNLQPYFKLNINRILSKGYFNPLFIASGKFEFKMGLEIEGCSSFKSPSCANPLGAPLSAPLSAPPPAVLDYILDSLLISYYLQPSTYNLILS